MLVLFCCFVHIAFAGVDTEEIKTKYPKHNAVITERESFYLIDIEDDSLVIEQEVNKKVLILNEYSKEFTNDYIAFDSFVSVKEKEAYTMVPKGKGYTKIKVKQYNETSNKSGSSFFDDGKVFQFSYPSLQKGAIAAVSYTMMYNDPHFLNKFFFESYIPVLKSKIVLKVHPDVKVGFKLLNGDEAGIRFREYKKGKYRMLEWVAEDMEAFKYMSANDYSISYYSPHLAIYINETNINGQKKRYFGNVDDLYRFNSGMAAKSKKIQNSELEQMVNKLCQGLTDEEKVKAIYYWVQNNIKYVGYQEGYMGFIPAPASEVFTKRYGDCKGMSNLIHEMMRYAGLQSYLTWVGTRIIPYKYKELPLPSVDNHMITTYLSNDSVVVLDGTFKYLDYGVYPYHIQGKEILIGLGKEKFSLFEIPIAPAVQNQIIDSVTVRIDGNGLLGSGKRTQIGYNKVELAYAMDGVKIPNYNKSFSRLFNKGSNKFNVTGNRVQNIFERDSPAKVHYDFVLHDYCKSIDDEIYINLNLTKAYQGMVIDTANVLAPIENDFYFIETYVTRLEIPDGYELSYLPKGGKFWSDDFGFTINYRLEGNYVVMTQSTQFEFLLLLKDDMPRWNSMIKKLNKQYRASIVLKKIS